MKHQLRSDCKGWLNQVSNTIDTIDTNTDLMANHTCEGNPNMVASSPMTSLGEAL